MAHLRTLVVHPQEHDDLIENTNFFKHPTTLGWCPEINELFTRTMGAGPVKGLRQLAPGEVLHEEEEEDELVCLSCDSMLICCMREF